MPARPDDAQAAQYHIRRGGATGALVSHPKPTPTPIPTIPAKGTNRRARERELDRAREPAIAAARHVIQGDDAVSAAAPVQVTGFTPERPARKPAAKPARALDDRAFRAREEDLLLKARAFFDGGQRRDRE
jgi:hypothetical protein